MEISEGWSEKVMHGSLGFGEGNFLYFSDGWEESPLVMGTNNTVHLQVDSESNVYRIVSQLSEGGVVTMPAAKTFWNSVYGSFIDKFGIPWGIEFELK